MFIFDNVDEYNCKNYYSIDRKYSVVERPDGVFLTYKLNEEDGWYDWLEDKSFSLKECEKVIRIMVWTTTFIGY